jgi:hypothetical protein
MRLARFECRWAEAAMQAIFPGSAEAGLTGIHAMDVRSFLRELMQSLPWRAAMGFRLAVWLVAVAPLFLLHRFVTIARLPLDERERVLAALVASRSYAIRSLVLLLKALGALLYAADERVRARMAPPRSGAVAVVALVAAAALVKRVHAV